MPNEILNGVLGSRKSFIHAVAGVEQNEDAAWHGRQRIRITRIGRAAGATSGRAAFRVRKTVQGLLDSVRTYANLRRAEPVDVISMTVADRKTDDDHTCVNMENRICPRN